jgi:peptidoglycan hydrolase-like protein with peptidoglycan-binding domain
MREAVKTFQKDRRLTVDGIIGKDTLTAMLVGKTEGSANATDL